MQIEFVNHAAFLVSRGSVRLMTDPWLEGTSFDDGWALLSPTAFSYERFSEITHLWFSHEHPDHFSPPSIRKIPAEHRRNITVYYQATGDRKVVEYCRKMNFKEVVEMPPQRWFSLEPGFEFLCRAWPGFEDSWSCVRTPEATILNLNDCTVNTVAEMESVKAIVGEIDVLFTQFSISAWDGNAVEKERRLQGARVMLERAILQCNILRPKYVVPFASFLWFCHEENSYMNEGFLPIDEVAEALATRTGSEPIVMYPGDVWTPGRPYDSAPALAKYRRDLASVPSRERLRARTVPEAELIAAGHAFCAKVVRNADRSKLRLHLARQTPKWRRLHAHGRWSVSDMLGALLAAMTLRVEPARIYVPDHCKSYLFDPIHGLRSAGLSEEACDVAIGSEALWYGFEHLWGGQSMHFSGRFRRIHPEERGPLFAYYALAGEQNAGRPVSWRAFREKLGRLFGFAK